MIGSKRETEMAGIHELLKGSLLAAAIVLLPQLPPQAALAQSKPAPANVRFAVMGVANFTPVLVARDKGFFSEENLNVSWTTVNQGAIAVEAVFGGSAEIGG